MSRMSRTPGHTWTFVEMIGQIWTKDLGHVQDMSRDVHHVLVLWIDLDITGRIWTSLNWTKLDKLGNIRACPVVSRFVQCGCVQFKLATAATPARRARPAQRNLYQRLSLYMYPFYSRRRIAQSRLKLGVVSICKMSARWSTLSTRTPMQSMFQDLKKYQLPCRTPTHLNFYSMSLHVFGAFVLRFSRTSIIVDFHS